MVVNEAMVGTREELAQHARQIRASWHAFFPKGKVDHRKLQQQLNRMCEINKHEQLRFPLTTPQVVKVLDWLGYRVTCKSIRHLLARKRIPKPKDFSRTRSAWLWDGEDLSILQAYLEGRRHWQSLHVLHIDKMTSAEIGTQLADQQDDSWSDEIAHFSLMEVAELISASEDPKVRDYLLQGFKALWAKRLGEDDADIHFPEDAELN